MSLFDAGELVDTTALSALLDQAVAARLKADRTQAEFDQALVDAARHTDHQVLADHLGITTGWIDGAITRTRHRAQAARRSA